MPSMCVEFERARPRPCTVEVDILEMVFNQFANARTAVDMWNDLEQEVGFGKRGEHRRRISGFVLVTHGAGGYPHGPIVEGTHECVGLGAKRWLRKLFRKAPKLPPGGDRRFVVEEVTAPTLKRMAPLLMRSKSTSRSSVDLSACVS